MKTIKIKGFNLFEKSNFLFESKPVWFAVGDKPSSEPVKPAESTEGKPEGPAKTPEEKAKELKDAEAKATQLKIDNEIKENLQKEQTLNALVDLAKGEKKPDADHMKALIKTMQDLKAYEVKDFQKNGKINDSNVKCTMARADKGGFTKVDLYAFNDSKGYTPNVLGKEKDGKNITEKTFYFDGNGNIVQKENLPKDVKFDEGKAQEKKYKFEINENSDQGKLAKALEKAFETAPRNFEANADNITELLNKIPQGVSQLPGGFNVLNRKGPNDKSPNPIIFKNGKALCYMLDNKLQKATSTYKEFYKDRYAETMAATTALDIALKDVKGSRAKTDLIISPKAAETIKASLINCAKYIADSCGPKFTFALPDTKGLISFERKGDTDGFFIVNINGNVFAFDTTKPNTVLTPNAVDKNKWVSRDFSALALKPNEREEEKVKEKTEKAENEKKTNEQLSVPARKEVTEAYAKEEIKSNFEAIINPKFRQYLKPVDNDPKAVKVDFSKTDGKDNSKSEVSRLTAKTAIHNLFNLKDCSQIIMVSINGKKGMYYPEQKTFYEMKGDKQTNKQIRFTNGDIIKIETDYPTDKYRNDAVGEPNTPKEIAETLASEQLQKERIGLLKEFKGKIEDLNKKALGDIRSSFPQYDSSLILKQERKKESLPDQIKILRAENAILKEGIIALRVKARVEEMKKEKPKPAPAAKPAEKPTEITTEAQLKVLIETRNKLSTELRKKGVKETDITDKEHQDLAKAYQDCGLKVPYKKIWIFGEIKKPNLKFSRVFQKEVAILTRIKTEQEKKK